MAMSGNPRDPLKDVFEDAVSSLDAASANRLRLMRRQALSGAPSRGGHTRLLPLAAAGAAVLVLGLAWRFQPAPVAPAPAPVADAALSLDLPSDEDAALYAWLGEAPVAADGEAL
jgi:hypothetical protein